MPEGDSLHRLAAKLAPVLEGREVIAFSARRLPDVAARSLVGRRVVSVAAKGKNLLVRFDDARVLHIHLRMEGRVFVERPRSTFWLPSRSEPDMRLAVAGAAIVGRRLPVLRLLTASEERRSPDLAGLGPDLVAEGWDEAEAVARLRALADREIAEALLVQRAVAGIGNVYKSEVCFLEGVDPRALVSELADDELVAILRRASALLRKNLGDGPRVTRPSLGGARLWVYGRGGRACLRCRTPIVRFLSGPSPGRSTYACPTCQQAPRPRREEEARP
ncbi:MAG: Fpg/Nei family DNA glycosylase [Labilithrix sp.]|nr:Fpg/Nei family DNA glycosylase [Labilithrix sp.]